MPEPVGVGYWIFNYMPKWEAASKEVERLAEAFDPHLGTRIVSLNVRGARISLRGRHRHLPLPWALLAFPLLGRAADVARINHIFASPAERLLAPRLARRGNALLTISKDSPSLQRLERNLDWIRTLQYVVVESERHRDLLLQAGVEECRVKLIYPGVERRPYVPAQGRFTILFASSPRGRHEFLSRGIYLMLRVAKLLPAIDFLFVWRERNHDRLLELLRQEGVTNVRVVNGFVEDMGAIYDAVHATILPALTYGSLKPCPHSGVDSLAHGKPLLVSRAASVSQLVEREGCGVAFEPETASLRAAIECLAAGYAGFQERAHAVLERHFSTTRFVELYGALYDSMGKHPS